MADTAGMKEHWGHDLTYNSSSFSFMCYSIILFSGFTFTVGEDVG